MGAHVPTIEEYDAEEAPEVDGASFDADETEEAALRFGGTGDDGAVVRDVVSGRDRALDPRRL